MVGSLFQVMIVSLIYSVAEGRHFSSFYIFYGSLFFALIYVSAFRWAFEQASGAALRAAGYRRRAVLVGSGPHIQEVAAALGGGKHPEVEAVGFVSLTPLPANGLKDLGPLDQLDQYFGSIDEVLIADPDFPQSEAVELVDRCHRHGVRVRVAPSTMEILMDRVEFVPGQTLPLFELKPPVFEGADWLIKRTFDIVGALFLSARLLARDAGQRAGREAQLARPGALPLDAARASAALPSPVSSSARCTRTPRSARRSSRSGTRRAARSSRSRATRA